MADPETAKVIADYIIRRDAKREDERAKIVSWHRRRASERQGIPLGPDEGAPGALEPLPIPDPPDVKAVPVEVTVKHTHEETVKHEPADPASPPQTSPIDWCKLAAWLMMGLGLLLLLLLLLWMLGVFGGGDTIINTGGEASESLLQWLEDEKKHIP